MVSTPRSAAVTLALPVFALLGAVSAGCDSGDEDDPPSAGRFVVAVLAAPPDTTTGVSGSVQISERDGDLRIAYNLSGLSPGSHGLHVHERASCTRGDANGDGRPEAAGAAGGHYDPLGTRNHSGPSISDPESRHLGDLGNVQADENGRANGSKLVRGIQLSGELGGVAYSMLEGRSVVVTGSRDDLESEPVGNAGARVGCAALVQGGVE